MAANESSKYTHFSNIQVGGAAGGGSLKGGMPVETTDAAAYSILAANSGKIHIVPDLTADCTFTLPAVERGLNYELWYGGAADDAQDWIINTAATADLFKGGVVQLDPTEATLTEVVPVYADFSNDDTLTVLTPNAGTMIKFYCDGTSWFLNGFVVSDTVPTIA
jgi:hypothetical protein